MTTLPLNLRARRPLVLVAALAVVALPAAAFAQSEDEDENPPSTPETTTPAPGAPAATTPPAATPGAPKAKQPGAGEALLQPRPAATPVGVNQGYLEGRAEVESPNEEIDTVQKKNYTAANRFELTVYPGALQLNSKFTNGDGVAIGVDYALQENFALQVLGLYNYVGSWTPLTGELYNNRARPEAADQLLLQGGVVGGFEVAPIYGKFAFYNGTLAQFRFVLNAGAGVGFTQVQLTGSTNEIPEPTTYASTGLRFLGNLGVGFRILLGERFALRLEVRDLLYTARVDNIDGCNLSDLNSIQPGEAMPAVSSGCNYQVFTTVNPNGTPKTTNQQQQASSALNIAQKLVEDNSSDVVNNIIFFAGLSYLF